MAANGHEFQISTTFLFTPSHPFLNAGATGDVARIGARGLFRVKLTKVDGIRMNLELVGILFVAIDTDTMRTAHVVTEPKLGCCEYRIAL